MPTTPDPTQVLALLAEAEERIAAVNARVRISIDQCFLLDMVEGVPAAVALRDALQAAVQRHRVLSPIHPEESVFESSLLPPVLRQSVFELQRSLAEGFCFHSFGDRVQNEVVFYLLERTLPVIWPRPFNPPEDRVEALSRTNRVVRDDYQNRLDAVVSPVPFRAHTFERILAEFTQHHNRSMLQCLRAIESSLPLPPPPETWEYAVKIAACLRQLNFSRSDLTRLRRWVESDEWHQSPVLIAFTRLWAAVEHDGLRNNRRVRANDLLDILRIAVGYADAQVVLCDNAMASFVRQSGLLQALPGRHVFGMRDTAAAMAHVSAL